MKKILILLIAVLILSGCQKEQVENRPMKNEDAIKFKEEYEAINGLKDIAKEDSLYREVTISEDNPFVFSSIDEIVEKIENKESFYVYFGDKLCPWCRANIEKAVETALKEEIETIYYVDVWDDERNEIVRDKYEVNEDDSLIKTVEASEAYYKLLSYLDEYLSDYELKSEDKTISVGEKRLFIPTYVCFKGGEVARFTDGSAPSQEDSREELSEEMIAQQQDEFNNFFNNNNACSLSGPHC